MSKRNLPRAEIGARTGMRTELSPQALERWNPLLMAASEEIDNSISILDVIGDYGYGEGVTAKRIAGALRHIGKVDVVVNINSPGGDFFEGLAIYNMLREHPARVTINVLGMAASAASVIMMAGDEIRIGRAAFVMIHNTWVMAMGDRNQLREAADWLEPFDSAAADLYAARTGNELAEIVAMLDKESWFGGAAAVDKGFADALLNSDEISEREDADGSIKQRVAAHKVDVILAKAGMPRSERRATIQALKSGTQDAAAEGTQDAALFAEVHSLLDFAKSI